ncbi:hypothetical protein MHC_01970 [Mycoplasma haemocanis str. Illinois]|uniref:Uncharacterized protein n=1 Tax=Mycoplasma haemocanis (strain Illinois) TaxID=1111676 RepID=H6N6I8_MYCHN|nr:hypothetical protein [Mycoplasma haemocanis]AEW45260.1 hypothetical protein MHC_01970 [Mycoplasma haemocanis str. Illinois]
MGFSVAAKIATGAVGVGAVAGGGAFASYKFLTRNTIEKYLNSLHRELATSEEDWELIKNNYSAEKEANPIPNIPKSSIGDKLSELKRWCNNRMKEEFSKEKADRGDYNLIQTWCTKQVKISSQLKHLKLTALETTGTKDNSHWTRLKDSYPNGNFKVNEITTASSGGVKSEGSEVSNLSGSDQKIKDWCSWASDQYFKHKEDILFKRYKYFCTKPD